MASEMDKALGELKTRTLRLRIAQGLFILVILTGLSFLIISNFRLTSANNKLQGQDKVLLQQIKSISLQNRDLSRQLTASNEDIKSHIDCIISFFGLPNRSSLSIADVCHFVSSVGVPASTSTSPKVIQPATQLPAQSSTQKPNPSPTGSHTPQSTPKPGVIRKILNYLGL